MYAMVEIKGKQYKVEKGAELKTDKLHASEGDAIEFDSVLFIKDENKIKIGNPFVNGAKVKAVVSNHGKDKKITVFKYKKRKNYRRKRGHRQQFSLIKIEDITGA